MRASDLEIRVGDLARGSRNAITDVAGVLVGQTTLVRGSGPLRPGRGPIRTGVSVIVPSPDIWKRPVFAGAHRLNGAGELTGLAFVRESGFLTTPIALTNTHSVGIVRDALTTEHVERRNGSDGFWSLPVVGETYDGVLNDINGHHITPRHLREALARAGEVVAEGSVGGGTGMICHGFKGGIGTASRRVGEKSGGYTVGVLVQANHGRRDRLCVCGAPVGRLLAESEIPIPEVPELPSGAGSIIVVIATDAPLLPHQCDRLAQRAGLGVARGGGVGEDSSGDLFLAFATASEFDTESGYDAGTSVPLRMLRNELMTALFDAVVEATEESILNALLAATTMTGRDGITAHALPPERLVVALRHFGRMSIGGSSNG